MMLTIKNKARLHLIARQTLIVAVLLAACSPLASAADAAKAPGSIFDKANAHAQARMVKIFGAGIGRVEGYGTGFLVSGEGHILTASGIMLSGERIFVVLPDGSRYQAKVERRSEHLQAALLKIDTATPTFFELPQKISADKGDWTLAVSNCFKVADGTEELSVNLGVISLRTALDAKRGTQDIPYHGDVLLIDAITSNPGAAGGAVVDIDGNLVGMVGRILESTSTNTRLNYAVPADMLAKFVAGQPLDVETPAERPVVGGGTPFVGVKVFSLGVGSKALAYVERVTKGSPADEAGLKSDDLIMAIGAETIHSIKEYNAAIAKLTPGEEVIFLVKRREQLLDVPVKPTAKKP